MSGPSISACLIVKNEEENLVQCLDSFRAHVDEIVIVDTGSTDGTRDVAVRYGASVYQFDHENHPEAFFMDSEEECAKFGAPGPFTDEWTLGDFAAARNESFIHATKDFVFWIDADDVLDQAEHLRTVVGEMAARGHGLGFLPYNYATDHLGRVFYRQWRERVFRRGVAKWHNPVHEVLMPINAVGPPARFDAPIHVHKRKADRKSTPHRNYKILLRQAYQLKTENAEAKFDPRILFYLGQEARYVDPKRAVGFYEEYLQSSGWPEERASAHVSIGMMLEFGALGLPPDQAYAQANREYAIAAAEMPDNPDGVFGLARIAYLRARFGDCCRYTEQGLKIGNTDSMLGANPMDRLYRPHVYYNHALAQIGRLEEAVKSCEAGLSVCPDDPGVTGGAVGMLKNNLNAYQAELQRRAAQPPAPEDKKAMVTFDKNEDVETPPAKGIPRDAMVIWAMQLWKQNVANGDGFRARGLLESLPTAITGDPAIARMIASTDRRFPHAAPVRSLPPHGGLDVVFYLGAGPEPWDPSTPATKGLGGSETAAIEMAKNLTSHGHRVVVYAEASGTFDGVEYRHHSSFHGGPCEVFIASRSPWSVEQFGPISAALKLLWVHDIHCGPTSPTLERQLLAFDRVLCLSQWHKDFFLRCYPSLHADKVIVTRNGIDPERFRFPVPKKNSLVFSSSPNRGLDLLLDNFRNHIKPAVPDAELHVFYGFDTWETIARIHGATEQLAEIERFKAKLPPIGGNAGGIYNHGKRPQQEVAAAQMRAKVWPYLSGFTETSCITAMEAMAAGAVPVYSALAALPETVGRFGMALDNANPNVNQEFCERVIRLLSLDQTREQMAADARAYALANLSWSDLAKDWSRMFDVLIKELSESPIPMWRSA